MIYTSYFGSRLYDKKDAVSISRSNPLHDIPKYYNLAPTFQILNWWQSLTEEQRKSQKYQNIYIRLFARDVLDKISPQTVLEDLDGKVLLCFEKYPEFCHRHIVRVWLNKNGIECKELMPDDARTSTG